MFRDCLPLNDTLSGQPTGRPLTLDALLRVLRQRVFPHMIALMVPHVKSVLSSTFRRGGEVDLFYFTPANCAGV
jgi:hypothetical protein